jgi:hypothetical protein
MNKVIIRIPRALAYSGSSSMFIIDVSHSLL